MAYTPQEWIDYPNPGYSKLTKARADYIEGGIQDAAATADTALAIAQAGGGATDSSVSALVSGPSGTRTTLETDFTLKSEVSLNEDVQKGVQSYSFQTGKQIVDVRGAAAQARTLSLSTSLVEFIADDTTTGNQTFDLLVDTDSVIGRVVVFHVPTYNFRIRFHATNVVVESWTKDPYVEIWGTLIFEDDGKWHVIAGQQPYIRGTENIDLWGSAQKLTTGQRNVLAGRLTSNELTTGTYNTHIGDSAGYNLTTGSFNTAIGVGAGVLWSKATINNTVAVGYNATVAVADGVAIGYNSDVNDTHTASVALGSGTQTNAANQVAIGARDLEIQDATKGVILKSPSGTRYRVTVSDAGALVVTAA